MSIDTKALDAVGLCLDDKACFRWSVPPKSVPFMLDAIGEVRNLRLLINGKPLHFKGMVHAVDVGGRVETFDGRPKVARSPPLESFATIQVIELPA